MLNVLAGYDRLDIASVEHAAEDYVAALTQPVSGFRVGIARAPFFDLLDADVARVVDEALRVVATLTKGMTRHDAAVDARHHARRGDLRVSRRAVQPQFGALHDSDAALAAERGERQGRRVRPGPMEARAAAPHDRRCVQGVDLVVLPTRRRTPRTVDAAIKREETDVPRNPELENTGAFNLYGIPAISIPCGFTSQGLPVGLMIAGPRFAEGKVLALAHAFEQATDFHTKKPPIRPDTPVPPLAVTEEGRG